MTVTITTRRNEDLGGSDVGRSIGVSSWATGLPAFLDGGPRWRTPDIMLGFMYTSLYRLVSIKTYMPLKSNREMTLLLLAVVDSRYEVQNDYKLFHLYSFIDEVF